MTMKSQAFGLLTLCLTPLLTVLVFAPAVSGHGTMTYPESRVYRVYQSNPQNPSFPLAVNAVQTDGANSYYTWNEVSRLVPQAVNAGLPPGFDYSPFIPDGALASAGRTDPNSTAYPRTYAGLDQASPDWPKTAVTAGSTINAQFLATAVHNPSVWDIWITRPGWDPSSPLAWADMEFLGRPNASLNSSIYSLDIAIPNDRSGHHVIWVAWQRNDPAGEVFVSTSDIEIRHLPGSGEDFELRSGINATPTAFPDQKLGTMGDTLTVDLDSPQGNYVGALPSLVANLFPTGTPPLSNPAIAELHLGSGLIAILFDGAVGPRPLSASGLTLGYLIPPGLPGFSVRLQGFALSPSAMTGQAFTATDAHDLEIN